MAKAQKKSTGGKDNAGSPKKAPAAEAKQPAGAAKPKGAAAKKPSAPGPAQAPLIDTNLAASAAAAMILNRAVTGAGQPGPASPAQADQKKESSTFKNMKDSLNKPTGAGLGGILGNTAQQKKSNLPFAGGKQVGRNQTFGADVNRAGVPRRTGG